jgi:hypothetical protein
MASLSTNVERRTLNAEVLNAERQNAGPTFWTFAPNERAPPHVPAGDE